MVSPIRINGGATTVSKNQLDFQTVEQLLLTYLSNTVIFRKAFGGINRIGYIKLIKIF